MLFPAYWSESSDSRIVSPSDSLPVNLCSAKFHVMGLSHYLFVQLGYFMDVVKLTLIVRI